MSTLISLRSSSSVPRGQKKAKITAKQARQIAVDLNRIPGPTINAIEQNLKKSVKKRRSKKKVSGSNTLLGQYYRTLADPFKNPGVPLGFRTLHSTTLGVSLQKFVRTIPASGEDGYIINVNPWAAAKAAGSGSTNRLDSFLNVTSFLSNTTVLVQKFAASSQAAIQTQFESYRIISAGLKVYISYPMTSASPIITGLNLYGLNTAADMDTLGPSNIETFPLARNELTKGGEGEIICTFRPSDYNDLNFLPIGALNNGFLYNPLVVGVTGLVAGSRLWVEAVCHWEANTGTIFSPSYSIDDLSYQPVTVESESKMSESSMFRDIGKKLSDSAVWVDSMLGEGFTANAASNMARAAYQKGLSYSGYGLALQNPPASGLLRSHISANVSELPSQHPPLSTVNETKYPRSGSLSESDDEVYMKEAANISSPLPYSLSTLSAALSQLSSQTKK